MQDEKSDEEIIDYIKNATMFFKNLLKDSNTEKLVNINFQVFYLKSYLKTLNIAKKEVNFINANSVIFNFTGFVFCIATTLKFIDWEVIIDENVIKNYQEYFGDLNLAFQEFTRIDKL